MIGISHLLRRVSQVCVTIGALVQQLILTTRLGVSLEIGRVLLHRIDPLSLFFPLSFFRSRRSRSNGSSTFSLFLSFSHRVRHAARATAKNQLHTSHFATRSPGIGARYGRLTGISKRRSYYHCTPTCVITVHVRGTKWRML